MKQIELFDDLVPIQQYLHVWSEAERERRIKKPCATALETQGESPENRVEETVVDGRRIKRLPRTLHGAAHGK